MNVVKHLARWHDITYLCNVLPEEQSHLKEMNDLGLDVIAVPWNEAKRGTTRFYLGLARNLLSKYPYSVNKDFDRRVRKKVQQLVQSNSYHLLVCDFVQMARNVIGVGMIPKLLFQHNVEAQVYRRLADNASHPAQRWFLRNQQNKMEAFERCTGLVFDSTIAVSQQDKRLFEDDYCWKNVYVIDTAVDTEYFQPMKVDRVEYKISFIGSMDWLPNQEGVTHFVKKVFPAVRDRFPLVTFDVVGRNPPSAVKRLGLEPGVYVTGSVDDVRPYIARSAMTIVPIYSGGGTRLKIFESMAMGTPVVSTTIGAEGLSIQDGVHYAQAGDDWQFANAICELLASTSRRQQLADQALKYVQENYASEVVARQFETICMQTVKKVSG